MNYPGDVKVIHSLADAMLTRPRMYAYTREAFVVQIQVALANEGVGRDKLHDLFMSCFRIGDVGAGVDVDSLREVVTDEWVAATVKPKVSGLRATR